MTEDRQFTSRHGRPVLRRAIDFDSSLTLARGFLAFAHASRMEAGWLAPGDHDEAVRFANSVVDDRGSDPTALALAARCLGYLAQDHARTRAAAERALCLNPHSAFVLGVSGWSWNYLARPSEAILLFRRAVRLSPLDPEAAYFHSGLAYAHLMLEQFGDALAFAQRAVLDTPGRSTQHRAVITALVSMDRVEEAREAATAYRAAAPGGARVLAELVERRFTDKRFTARMIAALRLVGLPE